ncbi:MAG: hypothetical protein AAFO69_00795 [Bacteroidota bacterium]
MLKEKHDQTSRGLPVIVLIKGMYISEMLLESTRRVLAGFKVITIDPYEHFFENSDGSLECISQSVVRKLDREEVQEALFISFGIGNQLSFLIAQKRADLVQSQILVGVSNKPMDPVLMKVYEEIMEHWHQNPEDDNAVNLLTEIIMGQGSLKDRSLEKDFLRSIQIDSFKKLKFLLKLSSQKMFNGGNPANYKIPNFIICADQDPLTHRESIVRFSEEIGINRGLMFIKDSKSNLSLVKSKSYELALEVILGDLLSESNMAPVMDTG